MGFFDVKNAKLVQRKEGISIIQREPLVDEDQFETVCKIANTLMKPGRDMVWVLTGKSSLADQKIKKYESDRMEKQTTSSALREAARREVVRGKNAGCGKPQVP